MPLLWSFFPEQQPGSLWTVILAWLVALTAALYRAALQDCSRSVLLENVRDANRRRRMENALEREEQTEIALGMVQVTAEIWFVLALSLLLPEGKEGGLAFGPAGSLQRLGWTFAIALTLLFPTIHALPRGLTTRGLADRILRPALVPLDWFCFLLWPLTRPLLRLQGGARRMFRKGEEADEAKEHLTGEIIDAVEVGERSGAIDEAGAEMIESVISMQELTVGEVMTPRTDLTAIRIEASVEEACQLAHSEGHSKIPVYRKNRDEICGIFQLRDVIPTLTNGRHSVPALKDLLRAAYFVPETKKVGQLLREFQQEKQSIAIVLDEYGGTAGVITVEDILEEIVGEIREEHDLEEGTSVERVADGEFVIDPRLRIEEVNEELEIHLPESEDYDTVGGFVFSHLDRIPEANESFDYENVRFQVLEVDGRRITKLAVKTVAS